MPISKEQLSRYPNKVFIETGTYRGRGVAVALECGFEKIYTIELDANACVGLRRGFANKPQVELLQGSSAAVLFDLLKRLPDVQATFWLDAHNDNPRTPLSVMERCPVLHELAAIAVHPVKTHTILIDDMRIFRRKDALYGGVTLPQVIAAVRMVREDYRIEFIDSPLVAKGTGNDILAATVPEA